MDTEQIEKLMKLFEESSLTEMDLEEGNLKIHFSKNQTNAVPFEKAEEDQNTIRSNMVGVFYRAPAEDDDPFVEPGSSVRKGDVLGIIESMKMMQEILSPKDCIIDEILIGNGETVEYDQPLFAIHEVIE